MSKPKRNDLCPCGSGKKYKKCHGAANVIEFNPDIYNAELEQLHEELIAFTLEKYEQSILNLITQNLQPTLNEEESESYFSGMTSWAVFSNPVKNQQTIFDVFYSKKQVKVKHTKTKKAFSGWANAKPKVYKVLSTNADRVSIVNFATEALYQIPVPKDVSLDFDDILIGVLIPYVDMHDFFFTFTGIPSQQTTGVIDTIYEYMDENGEINKDFPDFLGKILTPTNGEIEWENPIHEMVANLFTSNMLEKGIENDFIMKGVLLWHIYCQKENPIMKKLGSYAAALEYMVHTDLILDSTITQSQLAKEYETTSGTISTNYRKLLNVLAEDIDEIVDQVMFDDSTIDEDDYRVDSKGPLNMEREMREIQRLLEAQNFESIDEANEFLQSNMNRMQLGQASMASSPREIAQEKLYKAQEAKEKQRKALIDEALKLYPNSPDAYLLLAENAHTPREQRKLLQQAVQAGEQDLGEAFFKENKGHFWLMIETRPYMRAKAAYATSLDQSGFTQEALKHYEELLALNPNDNQGIRYLLLPNLMELEQYENATQLINQFKDEGTANFLFNKALLHYLQNGITAKTRSLLKTANNQNPFVKDFLLGKERIPTVSIEYIGFGDKSEAISYVQENAHLWDGEETLLEILRKL